MGETRMESRSTEILEVLRARGLLSKEEIVQTWSLEEAQYADLKRDFSRIASQAYRAKTRRRTSSISRDALTCDRFRTSKQK